MLLTAPNGCTIDAREDAVGALISSGFTPVKTEAPAPSPATSGATVAQLRRFCRERGITVPKRATRAQLVELLGE